MVLNKFLPDNPMQWTRENPDKLGIIIMRYLLAFVWLSQGFAKILIRDTSNMNADHDGFLGNLIYMKDTNPLSPVVYILDKIMIPNWEIILILVISTELFIGFSLSLGLFTRLGALVGGLMTISLWIMTLGWDEWIWTYPLIFFPHVLFFLSSSGRYVGVDKCLSGKIENEKIKLFF